IRDDNLAIEHQGQRSGPELLSKCERLGWNSFGVQSQLIDGGYMEDQRVKLWAILDRKNACHRFRVEAVGSKPINSVRGDGDELSFLKEFLCFLYIFADCGAHGHKSKPYEAIFAMRLLQVDYFCMPHGCVHLWTSRKELIRI